MYQLILFDLDGTIADTELVLIQTMLEFIKQYTPEKQVSLHELLRLSGPPLLDSIQQYFPKEDAPLLVAAFAKKAREFYPHYAKAFPGIEVVLNLCQQQNIPVGIVTSKSRINALLTLEVIGLKDAFPLVISLDEVRMPKPDPEGVILAMQHFHVLPTQTLFVGDTIYDYYAGQRAGVATALVTWSLKSFGQEIQPTYWFKDFKQLEVLIREQTI
jgi:pyrophosphatase PpaX